MIDIVILLILWTWGLTPLWVNIVSSIVLAIRILFKFSSLVGKIVKE